MKNNWQTKKLNEVIQKTETVNPTLNPTKEFVYIDVSSVSNLNFSVEHTTTLKGINAPSRARKKVRVGDIIFAIVRPTLKRIALIPKELDGEICSTGYFILRTNGTINKSLLFYFLQTENFAERMEKLQRGTSYPAVTDNDIKNELINFPESLHEQKRIVTLLDDISEKIEKTKKNTERNLQNSRKLFETIRDEMFNTIAKSGKITYLPDIVKKGKHAIKRGPFGSSITKSMFVETGYKIYEQKNAIKDDFSLGRYFINEKKYKELEMFKIVEGDIIISCSGTIGKLAIAPKGIPEGIINQALLKISIDEHRMIKNYFKYFFENFVSTGGMQGKIKGAAIKNITSVKELKQIPIPIPESLSEQKTIVKKLDELSDQTKKLEEIYKKKLADLEELKKSVLQKAFAGEL